MIKELSAEPVAASSVNLQAVTYFEFEEDFVEDGVRCIPMIVRFKMDAAGIKLKLAEWTRFTINEKKQLAVTPCGSPVEKKRYAAYLQRLIKTRSGNSATLLVIEQHPGWANLESISPELTEKAALFGSLITIHQWKQLSNLQRFVLLKLCRPGHEHRNFPKAMKEFKLAAG